MSAPEHVYTEAEILYLFGTDYDLPKDEEDEEVAPYRFLRQWYLVKKDNPDKPVSLPKRDRRLKDYILRGQLEPTSGASFLIFVEIPLSDQQCWLVDRTHEGRGIWIEPTKGQRESAWYRLHDPHTEKQASLHQNIRAKLGLLSNIIDALEEQGPDGSDMYYTESHFKLTPKQLHERLSCSDDAEFQLHNSERTEYLRFQEPFDYKLFQEQGGLDFCKDHMPGLAEGFDGSKLGKAIKSMKGKNVMGWTPEQYEESARLAEERSQRQPWGEPLPHAMNIYPNWYADTKTEQEQSENSGKKTKSEETNDSSEDEDCFEVQAAKNRTRRHATEVPPATAPVPAPTAASTVTPAPATAPTATAVPAAPAVTAPAVPTPSSAQTETATVLQNSKRERDIMRAALDEVEKLLKSAGERTQKLLDSLAESNPANVAASSPAKANVVPPSPADAVPPGEPRQDREDGGRDSSAQQGNRSGENDGQAQDNDETFRQKLRASR